MKLSLDPPNSVQRQSRKRKPRIVRVRGWRGPKRNGDFRAQYDRAVRLRSSQQLWLPESDLCKIKPPLPAEGLLTASGEGESVFSEGMRPLVAQSCYRSYAQEYEGSTNWNPWANKGKKDRKLRESGAWDRSGSGRSGWWTKYNTLCFCVKFSI